MTSGSPDSPILGYFTNPPVIPGPEGGVFTPPAVVPLFDPAEQLPTTSLSSPSDQSGLETTAASPNSASAD